MDNQGFRKRYKNTSAFARVRSRQTRRARMIGKGAPERKSGR